MSYTNGLDKPNDYFNTVLYTGTGATQSITGVGHQPDLVWFKRRDGASSHRLTDAVRGTTKLLQTNATDADQTGTDTLTSFDSDGFTLGADSAPYNVNVSGQTMVAWNWKANGTGVSNTDGSITSTVSANTTSGFSIVTWTGNSGSVGHGLGKKPEMIISKSLGASGGWYTTHKSLSTEMQDNYMFLNTSDANTTNNDIWGGEPTTSTFSVGSGLIGNTTHVAYCFNSVKGFSKFGSYTGNGSADGTFIYTGFKPAYILIKRTDVAENWVINDNKTSPYNPTYDFLLADSSGIPTAGGTPIDIVSNGFKIRTTSAYSNASGGTYIYMCFSEHPIVSSSGVPCTAR